MTETTITRTFPLTLERSGGDGRTIGGRCVPYNVAADVSDDGVTTYREMFAPGAFGKQTSAPARIELRYLHGAGLLERIGRGTQLEDRDDGLWGMFHVRDGVVGDQALALVDDGFLTGLSVSGRAVRSTNRDGVVVRERVHLSEVSLCEVPAYAGARVSMRRSRLELEVPEPPDSGQLARLAAIGIRVRTL
jgi:HK97 family phage prohead protease